MLLARVCTVLLVCFSCVVLQSVYDKHIRVAVIAVVVSSWTGFFDFESSFGIKLLIYLRHFFLLIVQYVEVCAVVYVTTGL